MALVRRLSRTSATALVTLVLASPTAPEQAPQPTEYEVKAAFLYHFGKFVKWPEQHRLGQNFVIAVLGEDPFGEVLDRTFAGKTVLDRRVEIRRIRTLETPADIEILFVGSSEAPRLPQILKTLNDGSVLTVSEMVDFTERGGMIGFRLGRDVVHFDVNLDQANRVQLKLSSQLVRLARNVIARGGSH